MSSFSCCCVLGRDVNRRTRERAHVRNGTSGGMTMLHSIVVTSAVPISPYQPFAKSEYCCESSFVSAPRIVRSHANDWSDIAPASVSTKPMFTMLPT